MLSWVWLVTLHVYVSIKRRTTTPPIKYFWICPCNSYSTGLKEEKQNDQTTQQFSHFLTSYLLLIKD